MEKGHDTCSLQSETDEELMRLIQRGSEEAFGVLVRRYTGRVIWLSRKILGNQQAAEDAAQMVFLRVWLKAGSWRPEGRFAPWIYAIAKNMSLNELRKRDNDRKAIDSARSGTLLVPSPEELDPIQVHNERWEALAWALESLEEYQRVLIELRHLNGFSYAEIAKILCRDIPWVKLELDKARRRLRVLLERRRELFKKGVLR